MASKEKIIGIVPIRAGSKGLKNKNILPLNGIPLFCHALVQGRRAGIDHFVISTDIPDVFDMDLGDDVTVMRRPAALATDEANITDVLKDLILDPIFDNAVLVLLQATSPLRSANDIKRGIDHFAIGSDDLVMSVCPADQGVLKYGVMEGDRFVPMRSAAHMFSNRQALPPVYRPNGAIYVFSTTWFRENGSLETANLGTVAMSLDNSVDIDTVDDFETCEQQLMDKKKAGKQ